VPAAQRGWRATRDQRQRAEFDRRASEPERQLRAREARAALDLGLREMSNATGSGRGAGSRGDSSRAPAAADPSASSSDTRGPRTGETVERCW
jgi:hypothetical protein